jgi:hypothetical protein
LGLDFALDFDADFDLVAMRLRYHSASAE